jgi:uncharacterized repeat protein (TIGR03803 family)
MKESHMYESFVWTRARYVWQTTVAKLTAVFLLCATTVAFSSAQVTTLVNFDRADGSSTYSNVIIQGADGNFYGATYLGGANGGGTIYKMTAEGAITTIYDFCSQTNCIDGSLPMGSLAQAANGDFYGTTENGGTQNLGTVFKITPAGKLTTLHSFCALANCADGKEPDGGLVRGRNGNFYGTTRYGGVGGGTVFEITPSGQLITLHNFVGTDGSEPNGELVQATNGNFYGETLYGGAFGDGAIFKITPGGSLTTLFSFEGTNGEFPNGGLIQAANGNFYGVTFNGGTSSDTECSEGCGTVFKVTSAGKLTTLYNFCSPTSDCTDGAVPFGPLVQATDGNFYGTTSGDFQGELESYGTAFEITRSGVLTTLYTFCSVPGCTDGGAPLAGLLHATNGDFYGTTSQGGADGLGTIFSLTNGLGPFVKTEPLSAKQGETIGVFGQGFDTSSQVQFGGAQATNIKLSGSSFLFATVPAGALTGSVTVTTGATTLTSNQQFRVKPQVLSFDPPSGSVGTQVTITGTGFTQTNGVGFGDNLPAQFTVNSDTQVTATVPAGAKTGPVGVLTKGGTAISSSTFTVN